MTKAIFISFDAELSFSGVTSVARKAEWGGKNVCIVTLWRWNKEALGKDDGEKIGQCYMLYYRYVRFPAMYPYDIYCLSYMQNPQPHEMIVLLQMKCPHAEWQISFSIPRHTLWSWKCCLPSNFILTSFSTLACIIYALSLFTTKVIWICQKQFLRFRLLAFFGSGKRQK